MLRSSFLALILSAGAAYAQSCELAFTIEVTQGVGMIRPGTELDGSVSFVTSGDRFRQEDGVVAHLLEGEMRLEPDIRGGVWTMITTMRDFGTDLVSVYAKDVTGFSFAGVRFDGPMVLTLYGAPGTRADQNPPQSQADWDELDLRRSFQLHAFGGNDMLGGDITALEAECSDLG
ncbi:MAG: hypothetical protein AAF825_10060 [Pseudomonadota bacterium]